ncbi:MAG: hypothetical protein ACXVCS_12245, partial [Bdellovibrionota bacterium]
MLAVIFAVCIFLGRGATSTGHIEGRYDFFYSVAVILTLGGMAFRISRISYFAQFFAVSLGVALVFSWQSDGGYTAAGIFSIILISRLAVWLCFRWLKKSRFWIKTVWAVLISVLFMNIFRILQLGWQEFHPLVELESQRLIFLIYLPLLSAGLLKEGDLPGLFSLQLWFPFQFFYPLPTRLEVWRLAEDRWHWQVRGFVDILIGLVFLRLFFLRGIFFMDRYSVEGPMQLLRFGLISYLETYFLSCGAISVPVGVARFLGFPLPDAYGLPL